MNKYPTLRFKESKKHNEWEVMEDFHKDIFVVKKGFITDLASIPRMLWGVIPPFGKWIPATVVHDWLYRTDNKYTRGEADFIMFSLLLDDDVSVALATIMYLGVRLFGKKRWEIVHG